MVRIEDIKAGIILHGPMAGVDHDKFYIIAGISGDTLSVCSVIINSSIHPFIQKRPNLLKRQIQISEKDYSFLNHISYINCAQPIKIPTSYFLKTEYLIKAHLKENDLNKVIDNIIASGELSAFDIQRFFKK